MVEKYETAYVRRFLKSGRLHLNQRPFDPQPDAPLAARRSPLLLFFGNEPDPAEPREGVEAALDALPADLGVQYSDFVGLGRG